MSESLSGFDLAEVALSYLKLGDLGLVPMRVSCDGTKQALVRWKSGGMTGRTESLLPTLEGHTSGDVVLAVVTGCPLADGGYLACVDVDTYKPEIAAATARLEFPRTATSVSPRGGKHYFYRTPHPVVTFVMESGIEVKGARALATLPPGLGSHWMLDRKSLEQLDPFIVGFADAPEWLLLHGEKRVSGPVASDEPIIGAASSRVNLNLNSAYTLEEMCERVKRLTPGNRRFGLLRVAGRAARLARQGLVGRETAIEVLMGAASSVGITPSEAFRIIEYPFSQRARKEDYLPCISLSHPRGATEVLAAVEAHLRDRLPGATTDDLCRHSDLMSVRYLGERIGMPKTTVDRHLAYLLRHRLIWEGPRKQLRVGQRHSRRFGIRGKGLDVLRAQGLIA